MVVSSLDLTNALTRLRAALTQLRLPLDLPGAAAQLDQARQMVDQLDDYVLPRLVNLEAPLLAVVGGSTGAGKSTLVNSLIGREVSRPGVIRPTTRSPVLIHHPTDRHWFDESRILPGLIRTRLQNNDLASLQLVAEPSLPPGLALLDAPDIDSVVESNRRLAGQLLEAADLWLFVTSAARYADAVPWEFLQAAAERSAVVAVVLDRVPPAAMGVIPADLGRLMTARGLADSPLFAVPETLTDDQGLLPDAAVAPIRNWLATLAADKQAREQVVLQTLDGAVASLTARAPRIAAAVEEQAEVGSALSVDAAAAYAEAARAIGVKSADGTLLRGEVLARWHDYVGTTEFFKAVDSRVSWLRDRITGLFRNEPEHAQHLQVAAGSGLQTLLVDEGEAAAERAALAWQGNPAGRRLISAHPELGRASAGFQASVERAIRDWQTDVLQLVTHEGSGKRQGARLAAVGVNVSAAALMLVIFASTGGLTGAEVGVAGGATVLAQRLLESIFGDEAVRRLAETAKTELDARVEGVLAVELARFTAALATVQVSEQQAAELRAAVTAVEAARLRGIGRTATRLTGPAASAELTAGARVAPLGITSGEPDPDLDQVLDAELVEQPAPEPSAVRRWED